MRWSARSTPSRSRSALRTRSAAACRALRVERVGRDHVRERGGHAPVAGALAPGGVLTRGPHASREGRRGSPVPICQGAGCGANACQPHDVGSRSGTASEPSSAHQAVSTAASQLAQSTVTATASSHSRVAT